MSLIFTQNDWSIHQFLAKALDEKLSCTTQTPSDIFIFGSDADISRSYLAARYPDARLSEYDTQADFLAYSEHLRASLNFWSKWRQKPTEHHLLNEADTLPPASCDLLYANLGLLHQSQSIPDIFESWSLALKTQGMLFFSHLGPDSFKELFDFLSSKGIELPRFPLPDMHDLGDELIQHHFMDPVTDMQKITLTYKTSERFWRDMRLLNLDHKLKIKDQSTLNQLIEDGISSGHLHTMTLEIIYGHAVKQLSLPENETLVQFFPTKSH